MLVVRVQSLTRAALAALSFTGASACGFPTPEACELECGADDACPGGFECQAESLLCVPRGSVTPCIASEHLPNAATGGSGALGGAGPAGNGGGGLGGAAGAGGAHGGMPGEQAGASGAAGSGVAGSSGASGAGGDSSSGGAGSSGTGLSILLAVAPDSACTGSELSVSWRASGGVRPYTWRLLRAPEGLQPSAESGDEFDVGGLPSEPGALQVELVDAAGDSATSEVFSVYETPEVETRELPALCLGAGYSAQLAARGGSAEDYVWSAALVAGAPGTLEQLGLGVEGASLTGGEPAADEADELRVALAVSDAHCRSEDVEVVLPVASSESDACPTIELSQAYPGDVLPAPCLGARYGEALSVEGGEPPYIWSELDAPPGLHFDPDSQRMDGVALGDGVLAVEVTDDVGHTIRKSYPVQARGSCWLGYLASVPGPTRLELVDGRLLERQPENARRAFPPEPSSEPVLDFAFSPDGRFIAYRLGNDPGALGLELVRVLDGAVQPLDAGGGVSAYAWSTDATTLAVAYSAGGVRRLRGFDVAAVDTSPEAAGSTLSGVRRLAATASPGVDSAVTAYDLSRWAFLSRDAAAPERLRLITTARVAAGFSSAAQHAELEFSSAARLLQARDGVFVADTDSGLHQFFASAGGAPVAHAREVVVSPSGLLTGLARDGALQVYAASESSDAAAPPLASAGGCDTLLAWASARERVACAVVRGGRNQVTFFDQLGSSADLGELLAMPEAYAFATGGHAGHRRAFSRSGRWFAFSTDLELLVARVQADGAHLAFAVPASLLGTTLASIAFSPDETLLAIGAGNALSVVNLEQGLDSLRVISPSVSLAGVCGERFVDGADQFCGSALVAGEPAWSSDSQLVTFRSALGTLQLIDLSLAGRGGSPLSPDSDCSEGCSSPATARFQP
jgi:hypothetical protein